MKRCSVCGFKIEDGALFCSHCGTQVSDMEQGPSPSEEFFADEEFEKLMNYGAQPDEIPEEPSVPSVEMQGEAALPVRAPKDDHKKSSPKRKPGKSFRSWIPKLLLTAAVIVLLVGVIFVTVKFLKPASVKNYGLYMRDDEIVYCPGPGKNSLVVTEDLLSGEHAENTEGLHFVYMLGNLIQLSEDGRTIFYPDHMDKDPDAMSLYYRSAARPKKDPVKIDSGVISYYVNGNCTRAVYVKENKRSLYTYDFSEKKKIADFVKCYCYTDDLEKVGYLDQDNNYYLWTPETGSQKLASDVSHLEYVSEDLSQIYYMRGTTLYKQGIDNKDRQKIDDDVSDVRRVYDTGEIYYLKAKSALQFMYDFVDDDLAQSDSMVQEPARPDYPEEPDRPSRYDYDEMEEYEADYEKYQTAMNEYEAECERLKENYEWEKELYQAKNKRDEIRLELQEQPVSYGAYSVWYYCQGENKKLYDIENEAEMVCADHKPVSVLRGFDPEEVQLVKLSELYNNEKSAVDILENLEGGCSYHMSIGGELQMLPEKEMYGLQFKPDGSGLYYTDEYFSGNLFLISIAGGKVQEPADCGYQANLQMSDFMENGTLVTCANTDTVGRRGDLMVGGQEVDYDIYPDMLVIRENTVYYLADWDAENMQGTLTMYRDGQKTVIAEDVSDFSPVSDNELMYLSDYNYKYQLGTLYWFRDGKSEKVEEDVTGIITQRDSLYGAGLHFV